MPSTPRFDNVSCSQCGGDFGPGNHGFSHCTDHQHPSVGLQRNRTTDYAVQPLTDDEISQVELGMLIICGAHPMPAFDRLIYTARLGAKFIEVTTRKDTP